MVMIKGKLGGKQNLKNLLLTHKPLQEWGQV